MTRDHSRQPCVHQRIILKCMLNKYDAKGI
jgi:hypothetical protein